MQPMCTEIFRDNALRQIALRGEPKGLLHGQQREVVVCFAYILRSIKDFLSLVYIYTNLNLIKQNKTNKNNSVRVSKSGHGAKKDSNAKVTKKIVAVAKKRTNYTTAEAWTEKKGIQLTS